MSVRIRSSRGDGHEVGRAVPSAPTELSSAGEFECTGEDRGALGTARPTLSEMEQRDFSSDEAISILSTACA